jgi:hypothetical protein
MTGIVILPAGRDDAFEDYKQFIRDGHPIEDIESYLNDKDLEQFRTTSDNNLNHIWGTSVAEAWRNIKRISSVLEPITNGEPADTAIVTKPTGADNLTNKISLLLVNHREWDLFQDRSLSVRWINLRYERLGVSKRLYLTIRAH